ncbi:CG30-like [Spodoptera cosmioides nucleopolyhedrovirus]|uniref:CG30-like n=1 Tax=Spodoptera cosmioides nucleopolyhedrovirus TaxID=2605774 RepID=A0A6B7KPP0_9ABAC|nr:CG30-like [Spodoptera cosmioides nucleopolyhedrovirus]
MVKCNHCEVSGPDFTFGDTYALPLLTLHPCLHMFCIKCVMMMRDSTASRRDSTSGLVCVVCKTFNGGVFQNYILNGELLRFPVDVNSVSVYGKFFAANNNDNDDDDYDDVE